MKAKLFFICIMTLFSTSALAEWIEENTDPTTGLRTGIFRFDGRNYNIEPGANLSGARFLNLTPGAALLDMTNLNLRGADLRAAAFFRVNLEGSDLSEVDGAGVGFPECNLRGVNVSSSNFNNGNFQDVDLTASVWNDPSPSARITQLEEQLNQAITQRAEAVAQRDARPTAAELTAVEAERDARPTADQLAAVEAERDARPTADQLAAVVAERDARPTADQLAAVEAERDARPTAEALATVEAERDAIMTDIQLAYDEVNAATGGAAEEDLVAVAPPSSATFFDLVWTNSGDPADTIEMTIEFPEDTIANPVELGFGSSVQGSVLTIDYQGTVTVINNPTIAFNSPVELDFSQELMGQNGFGATVGAPGSGDFNLFGVEVPEGTFTGQNYFTLGAPDGSAYILTSMLAPAPVTSRFSSLELNPLTELYSSLTATNEEAIAERDAAIAERDARPTAEDLAAVEAERDARYTEDQIRALSADYTIGLNEAGNVQMKFNLFESADLNTFAPLTLNPDSVSVVDGSICLEFAPEDRAAFFRFSVE